MRGSKQAKIINCWEKMVSTLGLKTEEKSLLMTFLLKGIGNEI